MTEIERIRAKVAKQIAESPRKCDICGKTETIDDLILLYNNGKYMCDDCLLEYDFESEEDNAKTQNERDR